MTWSRRVAKRMVIGPRQESINHQSRAHLRYIQYGAVQICADGEIHLIFQLLPGLSRTASRSYFYRTDLSHSKFSFLFFQFFGFDTSLIIDLHVEVTLIRQISVLYSFVVLRFKTFVFFDCQQQGFSFCSLTFLLLFSSPV